MLGEDFNVIPSVMAKYIKGSSRNGLQPEFNAKLQYRDVLWIGGVIDTGIVMQVCWV